jgi:hypothetical protein
MIYFLLIFLLLSLLQLLLIISFKKPSFFSHKLKIRVKKEYVQIGLVIFIFVLYFLVFSKLIAAHRMQLSPLISPSHPPVSSDYIQTSHSNLQYEELGYRETKDLQNLYFLYLGKDRSQTTIRNLAFAIRKSVCKKQCIVNLYDNAKAYNLDMERLTITANQAMQQWNEQYYVFVAEHYLAYAGPLDHDFSYYPFKDWYYRSQVNKK